MTSRVETENFSEFMNKLDVADFLINHDREVENGRVRQALADSLHRKRERSPIMLTLIECRWWLNRAEEVMA